MDMITGSGEMSRVTETKFDVATVSEAGGEYTMPDYYPEVRRIVSYTAQALPDTKFLSGDTLEFGGTLAFTVVYIGEDGSLVSLPYATEYSGKLQLPCDVRGTNEVCIDASAEDIQCRVLAPRKISIRGRVRQRVYSDQPTEYRMTCCDGEGAALGLSDRASVQMLRGKVPVMLCGRGSATGNAEGEIRDKPGAKPVSCTGAVNVLEVRARRDAVTVRGEVAVRCLVFTADGMYAQAKGTLPFEETVSAQGCNEGDPCRAWGRVASVTVSENGEGGLKIEGEYDMEAEWIRQGEVTLVEDAYSTSWASRAEKSDVFSISPVCCFNSPLTLSGSGKRTTKPANGEYLTDMSCEASVASVEINDGKAVFTGKCIIKAYIASDGEVICEEISLPLKYECQAMTVSDGGKSVLRSQVSVADVSGRLEGDTVFASCELCLSICCMQQTKLSPVTKVVLDKKAPVAREGAQIKVFYPDHKETVWDVAKRYLSDADMIESVNGVRRKDECSAPILIPQW